MSRSSRFLIAVTLTVAPTYTSTQAVSIDLVAVGNPGNTGEASGGGGVLTFDPEFTCGAVAYTYNIGKYEVTAGQYTEFLNAVARTDAHGLYNMNMGKPASAWGCNIQRTGSPGSYFYSVTADWKDRPVNYVSYWDACRFTNWLHNGQPTDDQGPGTTETGAYTLDGYSGIDGRSIQRNPDWQWAVASEDEWYKAAYHKNDGATGNYFDYPTSSNSMPINILGSPTDPGNNATYCDYYGTGNGGYTIDSPYYRTKAGAHENSASPYGAFDQGGNIEEWNEAIVFQGTGYAYRGMRGGSFDGGGDGLHASYRGYGYPDTEYSHIGFRVVYIPEPASAILLIIGSFGLFRRRP